MQDRNTVPFNRWLGEALELYRDNLPLLLVSHAVAFAVSILTVGILAGPAMAGLALMIQDLAEGRRPKPMLSDLTRGFEFFMPSFLLVLSTYGIAYLFFRLAPILALPVLLVLLAATFLSIYFITDRRTDFWTAATRSYERLRENFGPRFGYALLSWALGSVGILFFVVGVFLTAPLYLCAAAVAYRDLESDH